MTKKILIIEDSAQDRKIIKRYLLKHGYTDLLFASTGEEGTTKAFSEKPDLIILDINLPKMSGIGVHLTLKNDAATKYIPIIFMTNLLKTEDSRDGMEKFVAKSRLLQDLDKTIKSLLG